MPPPSRWARASSWVCRSEPVEAGPLILHASSVALSGRGLLIRGASGSGKSSLALQLIALGAQLVSDDRTAIRDEHGIPILHAPDAISGLIEARCVGILRTPATGPTPLTAVVDLDTPETKRLPPERHTEVFGHKFPLFHNPEAPYFAAALQQYLLHGREA